jgi:TatD DNase family protein
LYVNKGLYLGIGGTSTYKGNDELREVIKEISLDKLLLETDCPYLSPEPKRGTLNTSSNIIYVIKNIAEIKGVSEEEVIRQTNENAKKLFNL